MSRIATAFGGLGFTQAMFDTITREITPDIRLTFFVIGAFSYHGLDRLQRPRSDRLIRNFPGRVSTLEIIFNQLLSNIFTRNSRIADVSIVSTSPGRFDSPPPGLTDSRASRSNRERNSERRISRAGHAKFKGYP